jgi:hypothetical protein
MDAGPMIAMSFGLIIIWSMMIISMIAVWNGRDKF